MFMEPLKENKSKPVQIVHEIDELSDEEKSLALYWLRSKKNAQAAVQADLTVSPNNITPEDIYTERNALRQQKA
jgi:acetyl-CoA acetyltransferase